MSYPEQPVFPARGNPGVALAGHLR